jgi:hypothetical protein
MAPPQLFFDNARLLGNDVADRNRQFFPSFELHQQI